MPFAIFLPFFIFFVFVALFVFLVLLLNILSKDPYKQFFPTVSYFQVHSDCICGDASKKNLEIRESLQRGIFVNNLTEVQRMSIAKKIKDTKLK